MSAEQRYELTIGLEVHIQLNTASKMFCGCDNNAEGKEPNTTVCPVCFGMPGMLPVMNKEAIKKTLLLGLGLHADISEEWNFERKNYFYPDLPKGYQITSATNPPLVGGYLEVPMAEKSEQTVRVKIHHVHLEEDAGKLTHGNDGYSYVDLNRSGTPLIELVTEPDITSATEAKAFLQEMQILARAIGISDADMEKGHLRCDANVSVHHNGTPLGKKVEVKNLNSFRMVERAINYEEQRQIELLESGEAVKQETRGWDDAKGVTVGRREKEEVQDYRYMPDPDLPPIVRATVPEFSDEALRKIMPELPDVRRLRLQQQYKLPLSSIETMLANRQFGDYAEQYLGALPQHLTTTGASVLFNDVYRVSSEKGIEVSKFALSPSDLVELATMLDRGDLTHQLFKTSLEGLLQGETSLNALLGQARQSSTLNVQEIVDAVLKEHAAVVEQYKSGNHKVYGFIIGQVMAKTRGQADPKKVNDLVQQALK